MIRALLRGTGRWLSGLSQELGGTVLGGEVRDTIREARHGFARVHAPKLFGGSLTDEAVYDRLVMSMDPSKRKGLVERWTSMLGPNSNRLKQMILTIEKVAEVKLPVGIDVKVLDRDTWLALQRESETVALSILNYLAELPMDNCPGRNVLERETELKRRVAEGIDRKTNAAVSLRLMRRKESDYLAEKVRVMATDLFDENSPIRQSLARQLNVSAEERQRVIDSIDRLRQDNDRRWARLTSTATPSSPILQLGHWINNNRVWLAISVVAILIGGWIIHNQQWVVGIVILAALVIGWIIYRVRRNSRSATFSISR